MNYSSYKQRSYLMRSALAAMGLAAVMTLSACGNAFVNKWTVVNVIQDEPDDAEKSPRAVNRGGSFEIVQDRETKLFRIQAGDDFSQFADQWRDLEFRFKKGQKAYDPISIVDRFPGSVAPEKAGVSKAAGDVVVEVPTPDIEELFQILSRANIQSLEGGPLKMHKDDHTVQMFLFPNLDRQNGDKLLDLIMFYCHNRKCNHNGVAHANQN